MRKTCEIISGKLYKCKLLNNLSMVYSIAQYSFCPYCGNGLIEPNHNDPWVYMEAILFCWNEKSLDRKVVIYKGQKIEFDNYYVANTPWGMIPDYVEEIQIDTHGDVFYIDKYTDVMKITWHGCPDFMKAKDNDNFVIYKRPDWTKYLPGLIK